MQVFGIVDSQSRRRTKVRRRDDLAEALRLHLFQNELRYALACADRRPLDAVFLLPVRLEACAVPSQIAERVQYADLFPDWERAVKRLLRSVRRAARGRTGARFNSI